MRILLANKFYYRRGGDCVYMFNLERLLHEHGHDVAVFAMDYPKNIDTEWMRYFPKNMSKAMAFTRPFSSFEVKRKFVKLLNDFNPDIVHVNNIHTQLSPIIVEIAHQRGIRTVWTLHDYKLLCPRYDCLRDGMVCQKCFDGDKVFCLEYRCMKKSKLASWIGKREAEVWNKDRLERMTDIFVCPSKFMEEKMVEGGFDKTKLKKLCNSIDTDKCKREDYSKRDNYYCYVGRLSHEKGVRLLIDVAKKLPYKLVIVGGGPLEEELGCLTGDNVDIIGYKGWDEIKEIVGRARFSVIPSEWFENNPLSVIEAQCLGTPVLGADIGGIPELVKLAGMTFETKNHDDLKKCIDIMWHTKWDYEAIAKKAQSRYDANVYYKELMKIYSD